MDFSEGDPGFFEKSYFKFLFSFHGKYENFSEFYNLKDFVINKMRCYNVDSFITVKKRGFCYRIGAIGPPPTIANSKVFEDGYFEEGNYDLLMTGLLRTRYYRIRAYAINDGGNVNGIGYGDTIIVQTDEIFIPNVSIIL